MASTWEPIRRWFADLSAAESHATHDWIYEFLAAAEDRAGHPVRDFQVRLDVLPVAGSRHWTLTRDRALGLLHALVTADLLTEPTHHRKGCWNS